MDWQVTYGGDKDPIRVLNKGQEVFALSEPSDKKEFMKLAQPATGEAPTMGKIQTFINTKANQNRVNLPPDFVLANVQQNQPAPVKQAQPQSQEQNPVEAGQEQVVDKGNELQLSSYEYEGEHVIIQENDNMESLNAFKRNADRMLPSKDGKSIWKEKDEQAKARRNKVAEHLLSENFVQEMSDLSLELDADHHTTNDDTEETTAIKNVKGDIKAKEDERHEDIHVTDEDSNVIPQGDKKKTFKKSMDYMDKKISKMDDFRINKPLKASAPNKTNLLDRGVPEDKENTEPVVASPGKVQKPEIKRSKTGFHKQESVNYKKQVAEKYGISEGETEFIVESKLEE